MFHIFHAVNKAHEKTKTKMSGLVWIIKVYSTKDYCKIGYTSHTWLFWYFQLDFEQR